MTPQEAMTRAVGSLSVHAIITGWWPHRPYDTAAAILDALPDGWVLIDKDMLAEALVLIQGPYGDSALDDYLHRKGTKSVAGALIEVMRKRSGGEG